jgi:GNAT superfamily N-acetyltransferase
MKIQVSSPVHESPRVLQIRGLFDLPAATTTGHEWEVALPLQEKPWNIGLIVGPSGCGKSTIGFRLWPRQYNKHLQWPGDASILDSFPPDMGIKAIAEILSSVGFSSPPAWLRPFHVLSTGQQFRVTLARLIAEAAQRRERLEQHMTAEAAAGFDTPIVFDEYTSVVDRTVAQIGSAAVAKTVRAKNLQFVALTCHEDVEAWLNPDWVYRPAENAFSWRLLRRRPDITLTVFRCDASAWRLFAPNHYLSWDLLKGAVCFLATWAGQSVAFSSWIPFFGGGPPTRREHRTVCLPDFQGVGIGNALSATIASMWKGLGYRAVSTTTHPSMFRARAKSSLWVITRHPSLAGGNDSIKHAYTRLTAGFRYVGPSMSPLVAKALLG